jgi:hypothetical protein
VHGHTSAMRSVWKRVCFIRRAKTAGPKKFSADYATHNFPIWEKLLVHLRDREIDVLEIGSFEGRSALFWLEFLRRCRLTCVDVFFWGTSRLDLIKILLSTGTELRSL